MKKIIAMLLCLVTAVSLFAGCNGGGKNNGGNGGGANGDKVVLTIGLPQNMLVEDYETNAYTKWLEAQTGYDLQFYYFPAGADAQTKLNSLILDDEVLPDILWNMGLNEDTFVSYGETGYFADLTEYYNDKEKSKIFWERMAELPESQQATVLEALKSDDGKFYATARIENSDVDPIDYQVYINKTWLDKLNLDMPTDQASLEKVLKAFRDKDPNGNKQKDEIPLIGSNSGSSDVASWLINMYTYTGASWWNVDANGKLYSPYTTNEYREGLKYVYKLIEDKLLHQSSFTMSAGNLMSQICTADGTVKVGIWVGHPSLVLEEEHPAVKEYEALPLWSASVINNQFCNPRTFITNYCKNKDAAWNLLMLMHTKESAYRQRYGEKGVDWVDADAGEKSFMGKDAEIKIINDVWSTVNNACWNVIDSTILTNAENEACQLSDDLSDVYLKKMQIMGDCTKAYYKSAEKYNPKVLVPTLSRTEKEAKDTYNFRNNTTKFINAARQAFCTGGPLDFGDGKTNLSSADPFNNSHWNAYLKRLKETGIEEWLAVDQAVYDRQVKG